MSGLGFDALLRHRLRKDDLYGTPSYWNLKAESYSGLARSNWPSNAYNHAVHGRQMRIIDRALGDVEGLSIADVGCGTGRASLHLASRGARVTGFDFAEKQLRVARMAARRNNLAASFVHADVRALPIEHAGRFDVALTIGCLTLACEDFWSFDRVLERLVGLLRPGGRVLFLEPIHKSRLLRRILRMDVATWLDRCDRVGLDLVDRGGMGFLPFRFALAFHDLPSLVVDPIFWAGEQMLERSPRLEPLSDYKWLLLRHRLR